MPEPLPLPLRVSVQGASTVCWSAPMGGPRTDLTFPRAMERDLLLTGRPAVVRADTVGGRPTAHLLRDWQERVVGWSPDVVVVMGGHYETIHLLWPNWLERHANSLRWRPRVLSTAYRRRVLRPLWRSIVKVQGIVDRQVPWLSHRRVRNAAADIHRLVQHVRTVASPLVIVMEAPVPSSVGARLFPGMPQRVRLLNKCLADVVASFGTEDVRLFPTNDVVAELAAGDRDAALPDGFHFTPGLHDLIGSRLAAEVAPWADQQTHLKVP